MLHDIDKSIKMTYLENIMIFKLIFNKYLQFMRHENQIMRISEGQTLQALNESPSQIIQMMNYISKTYGNVGVWDLWEIEIAEKHRSWWQKISENAHKLQKSSQSETLVCVIFVTLCPVRRGYYIATVPNIHDFFIFFSLDSEKRWTKGLYRRLIRHFRILFWI